jgi:hypothetical protein
MIETIVFGIPTFLLFVLIGGIRRLPWRYAGMLALGYTVFLGALRLAADDVDPSLLVALGGLGGGLAMIGWERGERERVRRSALFLAGRSSSVDEQ